MSSPPPVVRSRIRKPFRFSVLLYLIRGVPRSAHCLARTGEFPRTLILDLGTGRRSTTGEDALVHPLWARQGISSITILRRQPHHHSPVALGLGGRRLDSSCKSFLGCPGAAWRASWGAPGGSSGPPERSELRRREGPAPGGWLFSPGGVPARSWDPLRRTALSGPRSVQTASERPEKAFLDDLSGASLNHNFTGGYTR